MHKAYSGILKDGIRLEPSWQNQPKQNVSEKFQNDENEIFS